MVKFLMCDLPLLLDIDWVQAFPDIDWIQALPAIFSFLTIIGFAVALYSFNESFIGLAVFFREIAFYNEAGYRRPKSPLWFALGP